MIRVLPRSHTNQADDIPPKPINWFKIFTIISFVAPGFIILFLFLFFPVGQSVEYSRYRWKGYGELEDFVEWENYERLYDVDEYRQAQAFRDSIEHTLIIIVLSLTVQLPLAMALAIMVGRGNLPGSKIFRTIFFIPYVFSDPITAIIFRYVLHPSSGLVNTVLGVIPSYENIAWLADTEIALYAIFAVLTWKYFGIYMILYMAALQGVPRELEDAARIDGANEFNVLRKVTLPLVGPTIRLTVYLSVLGGLQQFVLIWILNEGGSVGQNEVIGTYLFKYAIQRNRLGFGSAIAVVLFGMSLIFSLLYQFFIMRRDYKDERG